MANIIFIQKSIQEDFIQLFHHYLITFLTLILYSSIYQKMSQTYLFFLNLYYKLFLKKK